MNKAFDVICPYCGHKYTTIVLNAEESDFLITRENKQERGWSDTCSVCNESLIVFENSERGMKESDLPSESTAKFYRLT